MKAASRVGLSCTARISCSRGWIDLPAFMHCPQHIGVNDRSGPDRIDCGYEAEGLRFEAVEAIDCLDAGRTESCVMPLDESISIAGTLDAIRAAMDVAYPDG